jgi:Holliday junction resolvasome RuvABC endonuclease subunit
VTTRLRALGIDDATITGWALIEGPARPVLLGNGKLDLRTDASAKIAMLAEKINAVGVDRVVIELPWLGKNVKTTIVLARLCGRFEQVFPGAEVIVSNVWQSAMLGCGRGAKRGQLKATAKMLAKATFGQDFPEDVADAIVIALWSLRTG